MKFVTVAIAFTFTAAFAVTAHAQSASAALKDVEGKNVGTVELSETASGTLAVKLTITGLPAGTRAFHIHEKGACDAAGKFESAGAHLAGGKSHGVHNVAGPHTGDLPNIEVAKDGTATFETFLPGIGKGPWLAAANVFDADGAAVVIHAGADDYRSQPAGGAGDRIACGVLGKK